MVTIDKAGKKIDTFDKVILIGIDHLQSCLELAVGPIRPLCQNSMFCTNAGF